MTKENFMDALIEYEQVGLDEEETIDFFQHIYDTKAYTWLQGHYGRTLQGLIDNGYINAHRRG